VEEVRGAEGEAGRLRLREEEPLRRGRGGPRGRGAGAATAAEDAMVLSAASVEPAMLPVEEPLREPPSLRLVMNPRVSKW
jgi:hypothetical protein